MTQYTHPNHEGLFPRFPGEFIEVNGRQIGSSFFKTSSPQEIEALGFVPYVAPDPEPVDPSTNPADYPLMPWQFKVMVDVLDVDAAIRAVINGIDDEWQRAVALRRYTHASSYEWSDPLLQQVRAAIGMSEDDLASHWMVAKDLRSTAPE